MGLSCLLLTSDAMLLKAMRTGFSAASVDLELRTDVAGAIELSSRRHLDGFVIDCDDASGARDVLAKIRSSRSNQAISHICSCERHNHHSDQSDGEFRADQTGPAEPSSWLSRPSRW